MKKGFLYYLVTWVCLLGLFNVIAFVTPDTIGGISKFEGGFWPGYAFITAAFLLHLISSKDCFNYADKWEKGSKTTLLFITSIELAIMLVVGMIFMFIPGVKSWIAIICCAIILAISLVLYVVFKGTTEHAERVNRK